MHSGPLRRVVIDSVLAGIVGLSLIVLVSALALSDRQQGLFALGTIALMLSVNRLPGRLVSCFLITLSIMMSMRYIVWRVGTTITHDNIVQFSLSIALLLAECYALLVLCLSYFQMVWPLERQVQPLPADRALWPTVDILVPTYQESLDVVRATVLAAQALDWPADRLNVYILDDGRRQDFRDFAIACGAGYITRPDNRFAKAGNLNHALGVIDGELVVVFDCDHVPVHDFLKQTVGWMVADPTMCMLQTVHYFYSADPFQRNLTAVEQVPPEGNMFYGLIQDGNDLWDSAFFCGSCAVIRRAALDSVGGFATETVTEDAHTALKMQRKGWSTGYLRQALAGGLATERLIFHIGQRMRWARGTLQIMRLDNPLLGRGLRWEQRLCYLSSMSHFLFAVPRIIFLTAPMAFLLLGQNVLKASPLAALAYAGPHILHSMLTLSRIEGRWRYTFWSELYETSLAMFLVRLTASTFLRPTKGRFNVTRKGTRLHNDYFDLRAVYPNVILAVLLATAVLRGIFGVSIERLDQADFQSMLLNTFWALFSLFIVLASIAVARETRQSRVQHRVRADLPVTLRTETGETWRTRTTDLSLGGAGLLVPEGMRIAGPMRVVLDYDDARYGIDVSVPVEILRQRGDRIHARWLISGLHEERQVVSMIFGRLDAWASWDDFPRDRPIRSFFIILRNIAALFRPRSNEVRSVISGEDASSDDVPAKTLEKASFVVKPSRQAAQRGVVASCLLAAGLAMAGIPPALGQTGEASAALPAAPGLPINDPNAGDRNPASAADAAIAARVSDTEVTNTLSLRDLGVSGPMVLRGYSPLQGVTVAVPANRVVTHAQLTLSGALSPELLPEASAVTVTLNEQYIGTIKVDPAHPQFGPLTFDINPMYFGGKNTLNFHFAGEYRRDCNDLYNEVLWARISDLSRLTLTTVRIAPERVLSRLPAPFFDPNLRTPVRIPMVVPATGASMRASGMIASWFGKLADFRDFAFPVTNAIPDAGNAIEIGENLPVGPDGQMPHGPTLLEIPNPNDRWGTVLVVTGRNPQEVEIAARALVLSPSTLGAVSVQVVANIEADPRKPYDAPSFVPTDRPVRFGELAPAEALEANGFAPASLAMPFHLPTDLYTWRQRPFLMDLWIHPPGVIGGTTVDLASSRLDVSINDIFLQRSSMIASGTWDTWSRRLVNPHFGTVGIQVAVPPSALFGQNQLQFAFDARPVDRGACRHVPIDLHTSVDESSVLDFRRAYHFTMLPDLAQFAQIGFPFTRMADLSETTVVMPRHPDNATLEAYLDLMGIFGATTWYPTTGVSIVYADSLNANPPSGDIIFLTTAGHVHEADPLLSRAPYQVDQDRILAGQITGLQGIRYLFQDRDQSGLRNAVTARLRAPIVGAGLLIGAQSPFASHRSVVAIVGDTSQRLREMVLSLRDAAVHPLIQGDLVIKNGDRVSSYRSAPRYTVGSLPLWMWPAWYLDGHLFGLSLAGLLGTGLLAYVIWRGLRRRAHRRLGDMPTHDD
ncbi:UDP-forming cellulose synthase catalytic subunit [Gluconacetobacter sacchari]|uniref:UDP-forming cellulose synthase catalytic subunit n=1 Tax=Gluconacetobacter sacchari TaxID=92759 RepID=UPI0039B37D32